MLPNKPAKQRKTAAKKVVRLAKRLNTDARNVRKKNIPPTALHHSLPVLTFCDLQQCFGDNTASYVESLAAVEASISLLNTCNGQTAHLRDRETTKRLWGLVGEEETLERGHNRSQS